MKAKLITSAMFSKVWESESNNFLANESRVDIEVKFSANSLEDLGLNIEFYSALVLYEDK